MVRASLHSVAEAPVDENAGFPGPVPQSELAENLEQHIAKTLIDGPKFEKASPGGLAGEGEVSSLKIHHDEPADPAIDPTLAECIRIPLGRDDVYADLYIRECDGTACVIYSGEVVVTIDDELSRHSAISAAVHAFYQYLMGTGEQSKKILAGRLNAYIANTIDDPTKIVPAGKSCEWPEIEGKDVAGDEEEVDNETTDEDDLLGEPPAGDAAVEIVAIAEGEAAVPAEACGEKGVVEAAEHPADDYLARVLAENRYEESLARAKDLYVQASQHRARLQANVKAAKDEEAERLDEIDLIESRGWQYFLPSKAKLAAAANETPAPSIPSHESTLPPPEAPLSPQAGVSEANDSSAPPAGGYHPDWQSVDIAALNLPKSLTTKLREASHDTIGKLEALRGTFEGLLSIAGVGRTKADAIEEALLGWLTKNRDSKEINEVREKNRAAMVAGESVALEMAAQGQ